ncbi:unnamed protein product [Candida verbasci]|uniref:DUF2428 domain-containing protein n=1 Tax=Candida verbasci TaxID=1227364 RepID=A0A9W4TYU6_9ASCO|nr:unnamed protein product [Candida verbasci]
MNLQQIKKRLIEEPIEDEVKQYYKELVEDIRTDDVLYNDTLAVCLRRLRIYQSEIDEIDTIFDSALTFTNTKYNPLLNSLQSLIDKLSLFNHDVQKWIDLLMLQPKTKNFFVLLGVLLKKGHLNDYPNYAQECFEIYDDTVANACSKTLVKFFKDDWREFVNKGLRDESKKFLILTHLLPGLIKKDKSVFQKLLQDNSDPLILVGLINLGEVNIDLEPCLIHSNAQVRLDSLKYVLNKKLYHLIKDNYVIEINLNEGDDRFISLMNREYDPEFENWLKEVLYDHLHEENNFHQKLSAMLILNFLKLDEKVVPLLVNNLYSNYKAIRDASLSLLQRLSFEYHGDMDKCFSILTRLEGRESEGGVCAITYFSKFKDFSRRLKDGLKEDRIHGYLSALAQIAETKDPEVLTEALEISKKYTAVLSLDQVAYKNEDEFKHAKWEINYAWKVLQAANELMLTIAEKYNYGAELVFNQLQLQLRTIKFRGAISSTYPFYERACKLQKGDIDKELEYIQEGNRNRLITRRSGGIIYIIPGILQAAEDKFDYAVERLFELAQEPIQDDFVTEDLPQIHAFNILKQIFTEKNLTNQSQKYLERGLVLSLNYFESPVWSIRNCAMMLFGSLKKKIFNNKIASKRFFARFKFLSFFIEKLNNNQVVIPILVILESLEYKESIEELVIALKTSLGNEIWKIRELTGKVLSKMINCEDLIESCNDNNSFQGVLFGILAGNNPPNLNPELLYKSYFIADVYVKILDKFRIKVNVLDYFHELLENYSIYNGKKLFIESLLTYLLNNGEDVLKAALDSKYENLYPIVINHVEENDIQFDLSPYLSYPNAIRVYSRMKNIKILNIENIEYRANFEHIIPDILKFTDPNQDLDTRIQGFNALYIYLKNASGYNYNYALMLLFERGLFDDDEDIRKEVTKKLCDIFKIDVSTTYLSLVFPTLHQFEDEIINDVLMRNTLDYKQLDDNLKEAQEPSLYSFERNNFYKNEIMYTRILQKFNYVSEQVKNKVLKDIKYIQTIPELNLPLNYIMLDYKKKTEINATIAGI